MSEWGHLPNARHIERIIQDVPVRPTIWYDAYVEMTARYGQNARDYAWGSAWNHPSPKEGENDWSWVAPWNAVRNRAMTWKSPNEKRGYAAASDPVLALCRWEHAGEMMTFPPQALQLLIASDDPAALLMYSVSLVFNSTNPQVLST